jgi:hypothetical protein
MNRLLGPRQILVEHTNDTAFLGQSKCRRPPDPTSPTGQNDSSPIKSPHIDLPFFELDHWRIASCRLRHVNISAASKSTSRYRPSKSGFALGALAPM